MNSILIPAQQATLDYHLRETNLLTNEELILELTDHYATALTERMSQGMTFEGALIAIQQEFGGRSGLQKMEREYNQVTFRHYDEQWRQTLLAQFQKPLLWQQTVPAYLVLLVLSFAYAMPEASVEKGPNWSELCKGFLPGLLFGLLPVVVHLLWPYLKATLRHGVHNVPTEALYLLKRQPAFILLFGSFSIIGSLWLLPLFIAPVQAILISFYLAAFGLYIRTSYCMNELLYEYVP